MSGLIVRDVDFNGATLKAVQDMNKVIWVGVKYVCNGIGLSQDQGRAQVKKIQKDLLLKQGCVKFDTGVLDTDNEVLAIQLDYLPAWLFKINITPHMERNTPELAEKLRLYQMKAKDVLAEAFLKNNPPVTKESQIVQLQIPNIPNYEEHFTELNQKIDKLYTDMGKLANIILEQDKRLRDAEKKEKKIEQESEKELEEELQTHACAIWKKQMYRYAEQTVLNNRNFEDVKSVLVHVYKYMNRNYGIVWEQESKEYKEQHNCSGYPATIAVAYENVQYRSIFESVLKDLLLNSKEKNKEQALDEIIRPLIEKKNDGGKNGCSTYRQVYFYMADKYNLSWKNHMTRYKNMNNTDKQPSKKELIVSKPKLLIMFKKTVEELLNEEN